MSQGAPGDLKKISKLTTLDKAIAEHVKPGMTVHIETKARAANRALARHFWGQKPGFTLAMLRLGAGQGIPLVFGGLVSSVITSGYSDQYPTPSPVKFIQEAYRNGLPIEHWSLCGYITRVQAGALGTGFLPMKSMLGTTMEVENKDTFMVMEDPFGSGRKVALVKALNPDISFVHADAADEAGNAIFLPPWEENLWGAKASRAVIVTAEKIVSTDFIKSHSFLVKLPSTMVKAVVHAPFGSHPGILSNLGLPDFNRYGIDRKFMLDHRAAIKGDAESYTKWIKEWILDVRDQEDYLAKVETRYGAGHLDGLRNTSVSEEGPPGEQAGAKAAAGGITPTEMMVAAAGRIMAERAIKNDCHHIQPGIGTGALAAFMAYYLTNQAGHHTELLVGTGFYGFVPRPSSLRSEDDCKMLSDTLEVYNVLIGGETVRSIVALGSGQVDKYGNLNSTRTKEGLLLTGIGGSNDAANGFDVVVTARQSSKRFVDKVDYITVPGTHISTLVSNMGIFEKNGEGEFMLTQYFSMAEGQSGEQAVAAIRKECGWQLKVSPNVRPADLPSSSELQIMRWLDPRGDYLGR